jgi:superfamily I DNA/RNA helicase
MRLLGRTPAAAVVTPVKKRARAVAKPAVALARLPDAEPMFDDWALPLTPALKKRIKADVSRLLPASQQPSLKQWKLIFSHTPATLVVAGAGAGKSSSLALRVLVLHHYLGFAADSISVVTFTRESRADFIRKLMQLYDSWGLSLSEKQASAMVRTFHSRLLPMVASVPEWKHVQAFESLSEGSGPRAGSNPFDLRINDTQRRHLNQCYSELLTRDRRFNSLIAVLRLNALRLARLSPDHAEVRKRMVATQLAAQRDEVLCDLIEDQWFRAGAWPIQGIEPERKAVEINGQTFHCHGYIAELDAWVVLGVDRSEPAAMTRPGARLPIRAEWAVKRTLFQAFCDKPLIWLENYQDKERLWGILAGQSAAGPGFDYKPRGDLIGMPLLDAFVAAASFIENLGLEVTAAVKAMDPGAVLDDQAFLQALAAFWPAFVVHLRQQSPPIMTYNTMFRLFSEPGAKALKTLPDEALRPLTHVMIDEFQDISPQIVNWLRASLNELHRRAHRDDPDSPCKASLMCVGDDWQSIYGWRGSSPHYFLKFKAEFPAEKTTRVMLTDNFRSHRYIIDSAEHLVESCKSLPGKKALAVGAQALDPVPVQILTATAQTLLEAVRPHYKSGDSILILYRKASDKRMISNDLQQMIETDRQRPQPQRRLRLLTYHSAKGLQADAVFLLGDCTYGAVSPWRNEVYRQAGLVASGCRDGYDAAQADEALRLAYVAITRAIRYCYWFVEAAADAVPGRTLASARIDAALECFDDRRTVESVGGA